MGQRTFSLQIFSFKGLVFKGEVESVYLSGTEGEFELLPYHFSLIAALPDGEIKIAGHEPIPIRLGILLFKNNACKVMVELPEGYKKLQKEWETIEETGAPIHE